MIINCTVEEVVDKLQKNNISFERNDLSSQHTKLKFENGDQLDITNINQDTLEINFSGSKDILSTYINIIKE